MFEDKVAAILNKQLGAFVDGLDASALNIGVWSGQIVLENLQVRRAPATTRPVAPDQKLLPDTRAPPPRRHLRPPLLTLLRSVSGALVVTPPAPLVVCPTPQLKPEALNALKLPVTVTVRWPAS